jgi:hypothetical protein
MTAAGHISPFRSPMPQVIPRHGMPEAGDRPGSLWLHMADHWLAQPRMPWPQPDRRATAHRPRVAALFTSPARVLAWETGRSGSSRPQDGPVPAPMR